MNSIAPTLIPLTEYQPIFLPPHKFSNEAAEILLRNYKNQVDVEFPTLKSDNRWVLKSTGWVGYIPLTPEYHLVLQPKVALGNLFRMLEYAYRLDFLILEGVAQAQSLAEFYERLAHILARRVLDRVRQGLYRAYLPQSNRLPYVRGRLNVRRQAQLPGQVKPDCDFQEHTADVEENRILLWTLGQLIRGVQSEQVLSVIRQAYRALQGRVTLHPVLPGDCVGRVYHRLNEDYRPLHTLCRFFLEQTGPVHNAGNRSMLPFLVNMARLFEMFVAEWLSVHLPRAVQLKKQESVMLGDSSRLQFKIDLVLYNAATGQPGCVLDTKYKTPDHPSTADIHQMISYAHATGCHEAILIYPTPLPHPFDETIKGIRVRSLTFLLAGDLALAGKAMLDALV